MSECARVWFGVRVVCVMSQKNWGECVFSVLVWCGGCISADSAGFISADSAGFIAVINLTTQTVAGNLASKNSEIHDTASDCLDALMECVGECVCVNRWFGMRAGVCWCVFLPPTVWTHSWSV